MRKLTYLAVLEPSADGYGVYFPDLPGCISCGKDIEDSQQMAREALELHIYGMEKNNEPLPEPSRSLDKEDVETGIITAITVLPDLVKNDMEKRAPNVPNAETICAINEVDKMKRNPEIYKGYDDIDEMMTNMEDEFDLKVIAEYESDPDKKTYSHEEVKNMLKIN
ncbi:type II toxin-antitoxin system HicB family antitoxin [Acetobacterium sp.]|uniref:type II toxin-antitoxin system HicB family antitoxin n=1 Tax=Acetobacterium sp. TaxID=1872094 RepID=UPI002F3F10D3